MFRKKLLGTFLLVFLLLPGTARTEDDFDYWQEFSWKQVDCEPFTLKGFTQLRLIDHWKRIGLFQLSEQLQYRWNKNLNLGLNYSFLGARGRQGGSFTNQNRIELEASPHFNLCEGVELKMRNRLEIRHVENRGWDNTRFRYFVGLKKKLKNCYCLEAVEFGDEVFYSFPANRITENRFIPLSLFFKVREDLKLKLFSLIRATRGGSAWGQDYVLGSQFIF